MYKEFEKWIDEILEYNMPLPGIGINFNIYEDADMHWSVQIISSLEFDAEDPDWCCEEAFTTGENLYTWEQEASWKEILDSTCDMIKKYLAEGKYANELKQYAGISTGFVDGDLEMLFIK